MYAISAEITHVHTDAVKFSMFHCQRASKAVRAWGNNFSVTSQKQMFALFFYLVLINWNNLRKISIKVTIPEQYTGVPPPVIALSSNAQTLSESITVSYFKVLGLTWTRIVPGSITSEGLKGVNPHLSKYTYLPTCVTMATECQLTMAMQTTTVYWIL